MLNSEVTSRHVLIFFREPDNNHRLLVTYASDHVMSFVQNIHDCLYEFLNKKTILRIYLNNM
jgi:hypothetical protein